MKLKEVTLWMFLFCIFQLNGQEFLKETKLDSVSIFFGAGKYSINNADVLHKQLNGLKNQPLGKIVLIGYTDSVGSLESNRILASKRLQSVKELLRASCFKDYLIDSLNRNEFRDENVLDENRYRRVDVIFYKIEPNYEWNKPVNLNIQFQAGSDHVSSKSAESLKKLLCVMRLDDSLKIVLNGHVCCQGDQPMSLKRAKRVKIYLVNNGIAEDRISCFGYSNTVKLAEETSPKGQEMNRRVEVVFLKQ